MPKYYKNKYLIGSKRLKNWDYRNKGVYFITINTKNRIPFFGEINNKGHFISNVGIKALQFWQRIPWYSPHVKLDHFIIMPDHLHGILIITKKVTNLSKIGEESLQCNDSSPINSRLPTRSMHYPKNQRMAEISPKAGSISTIIRSFKSAVTKEARKIEPNFAWQSDFHDRLIKDKTHLLKARFYIEQNPKKWLEK